MRVDVVMEHWTQAGAAAFKRLAARWLCYPKVTSSISLAESFWKAQGMGVPAAIESAVRLTQAQRNMQPILFALAA